MIEIENKEYLVRKLNFEDTYYLSQILYKTGFEIKDFQKTINGEKTEEELKGYFQEFIMEATGFLVVNYHKAFKEVAEWLASLIGVKPSDLKKMPIDTPIKVFKELAKDNDLQLFFKQVAG